MATTIEEILASDRQAADIITDLKSKAIDIPEWSNLKKEYYPKFHPVMDAQKYRDIVNNDGVENVTRITYDLQRLAVKRMVEMCYGIPCKRVYHPANNIQQDLAKYIEAIFQRNRIDSVNIERGNMLYAGCEVMTLWYAVEQKNNLYGFESQIKLRCRNFSPLNSDKLYPLFDDYGDLIALSVEYTIKRDNKTFIYFDTYTANKHIKWLSNGSGWEQLEDDDIQLLGKIPGIYMYRPTPIWEDTSKIVYEIEWAMSRNGNYLRKNSKPVWVVCADDTNIEYGKEQSQDKEFLSILQYPQGANAQYVTWEQAIENLKFYVNELRSSFFTQLQLPDWSYEKMSQQALSGESRKQLFIDAQMKVQDESGRLLEFHDREVNIIKAFLKIMLPEQAKEIDALQVETQITPYAINDEKDTINNLVTANGGKAVISQRESVEQLGWSDDVDKTMQQLQEENMSDAFDPTL